MLEIKTQPRGNKSVKLWDLFIFFHFKNKNDRGVKGRSAGSLSLFWFKMVALWGQVIDDITH